MEYLSPPQAVPTMLHKKQNTPSAALYLNMMVLCSLVLMEKMRIIIPQVDFQLRINLVLWIS